jgi:hypothetical protein
MPSLYFEEALLKAGWATGVRLDLAGGPVSFTFSSGATRGESPATLPSSLSQPVSTA